MKKPRTMLIAFAASAFLMCSALIAQGATNRSYVSLSGNDGTGVPADCQPPNPCRTFQAAIGVTNAGGQVVALDSAGYSGFSINKSITIEGVSGQTAFIFVGGGFSGVTVTGSSTDTIILKNIFVDGLGVANTTGLTFTGQAKLVVQNCVFRNLTTGLSVAGTNNTTLFARMDLIDSDFYGNGTAIISTGSGANLPGNAVVASTSVIRIRGGNITGNGTGVNQVNAGANQANIFLFGPGNVPLTNIVANTTNLACSPGGCNNNVPIFSYNSGPFGP